MKNVIPQQILGHGNFSQKTLLNPSNFVFYCKKRGISIDEIKLELFERIGVFLPILRIDYPPLKIKIKRNESQDTYETLGVLEDDEVWDGETINDYGWLSLADEKEVAEWTQEGLIYRPTKERFKDWENYQDEEEILKTQTYYSIFQILPLAELRETFKFPYSLEDLVFMEDERAVAFFRRTINNIKADLDNLSREEDRWSRYAKICQILSSRYLPYAESDGVLISVTNLIHPHNEQGFDFFAYRRNWNAKKILDEMEVTVEEIADAWEALVFCVVDSPISNWNHLIDFIKKDKLETLKDDALLAENYKIMANMLNLFYQDITGETLYSRELSTEPETILNLKGVTKNDFQYMEFIVNEFGLNPKPKLILMVEGEGEYIEIPKLIEWAFGKSLAAYRIQIEKLNSIGEFSSRKTERFIDHFHDSQTIVFFVLDDEGKPSANSVRDKLVTSESQYYKGKTISKEDFFTIWSKNIEFDNFTDEEIAQALTEFCSERHIFTAIEVKECRNSFGTRNLITLENLFKQKIVNYELRKTELLMILFNYMKLNPKMTIENEKRDRPILEVARKITRLAIRNHQPSRLKSWIETQNSDWLRNTYKGKIKNS